ncbi:ribosome small subunit-dependent GTPase A [uncultured Pseudodesulfovibrio sp.]|uniref:ribosome small subunit-dependent GTPase A n=1 Tax=uncultured Pseudodesulfovibrio sp. TaxID=2035858 RepID=UPI0029C6A470|nr:ribosome small subunit-dependent GTPase A [uncultured Pseudodesulfovibrio sp.]
MHTRTITQNSNEQINRLRRLGWNEHFESLTAEVELDRVARVISAQRGRFLISNGCNEWLCVPSGNMRHRQQVYPVTGDWVIANDMVVTQVLPRKNTLSRGEAGSRGKQEAAARREQPIAANIDTVFIVCGLDRDYNLRRIERYIALVYNCGMAPVVVLTKADLHASPEPFREEVEATAFGVPVVLTSIRDESGVSELFSHLGEGRTVSMIGSSGAGKSTLANRLQGSEIQSTGAVSESLGKGRHTTTARELIAMPCGGLLMDNPGIREIAFAQSGDGLDTTFADIRALAESCRFADCSHGHEPGCAVQRAVDSGELSQARLDSYRKLQRELNYVQARDEKSADRVERERWKGVAMEIKRMNKRNKR